MVRVDFHLHTEHSDGGLPIEDLLRQVRLARLTHWAITDHDTLAGYHRLHGQPGLIPGVEVTAEMAGREVHVVALGIDPAHRGFVDFLADIRALRRLRIGNLITMLGESARLSPLSIAPRADTVTRWHLASALVTLGRAASVRHAFDELIGDVHQAAIAQPAYPSLADTAAATHAAGGVAILAHPGIYADAETIAGYMAAGPLDGLETNHPRLDPQLAQELIRLAERFSYLHSCGSDTHVIGARRPGDPRSDDRVIPLVQRLVG